MSAAARQSAHDATYAHAYRQWVASLPPDERTRLAAQGIAAPDTSRRTSTRQGDALILALTAAPAADPGEPCEAVPFASQIQNPKSQIGVADALASFCARIRSHPNPMLAFDAACFASGLMDIEGLSETDLAKRHGVTRAGFSRIVVQWSETFGLPPSRGMRSMKARQVYRRAQLTRLTKQHDRAAA